MVGSAALRFASGSCPRPASPPAFAVSARIGRRQARGATSDGRRREFAAHGSVGLRRSRQRDRLVMMPDRQLRATSAAATTRAMDSTPRRLDPRAGDQHAREWGAELNRGACTRDPPRAAGRLGSRPAPERAGVRAQGGTKVLIAWNLTGRLPPPAIVRSLRGRSGPADDPRVLLTLSRPTARAATRPSTLAIRWEPPRLDVVGGSMTYGDRTSDTWVSQPVTSGCRSTYSC